MSTLNSRYSENIFIIWKGKYNGLKNLLEDLNQKHPTTKFNFDISKDAISILETKVYIDKNQHLQTIAYQKETNCQSFLHSKSEHLLSLKKNIPFSQALDIQANLFNCH